MFLHLNGQIYAEKKMLVTDNHSRLCSKECKQLRKLTHMYHYFG